MYILWESQSGPGPGFNASGSVLVNNTPNGNIIVWDFEISTYLIPVAAPSGVNSQVFISRGNGTPNHTVSGPDQVGFNLGQNGAALLGACYAVSGGSVPSQYAQQVPLGGMIGGPYYAAYRWARNYPVAQLAPGDGLFVYTESQSSTVSLGSGTKTQVSFTFEAGTNNYYP
jgi:hypothetical protein